MELWLSLTCLVIVMAINIVGLYNSNFKDNLPQCVGMVAIVLWAMAESALLYRSGACSTNTLLYVALTLYCVGTAVKVMYHVRRTSKTAEA